MLTSRINKIGYKLILAVGGVTVSIIIIFSYLIIESQHKAMIEQLKQHASQCSETIKSGTRYDMLRNQRYHTYRIIESISQQHSIEKIRIFNKLGEIIHSSDSTEVSQMVDKKAESCFACHAVDAPLEKLSIPERTRIFNTNQGQKRLSIINPIYNEPGCWQSECHAHGPNQTVLGVLDVTMSLNDVEQQIQANQTKIYLFASIAIITISFLVWILVQNLVGKPVAQLVKATKIVAEGNLEYKVLDCKNDELGILEKSFNDMTSKLVAAQRQLYQSDKLASLGRLTSGIAHEINNPLTGVLAYSSNLLKRDDFDADVKQDLEVIVRESKRCREIVRRLLNFARQEPPKKTLMDINQIIDQAISILHNQFNLNKITIRRQLPDNLPKIKADVNQLQQVLINLFVNAADATGENGGEIHISTSLEKMDERDCILIKVTDFGCGIPRENLTKIFEPFYTTKGQKGTGLGLAVVWGIIKKHNGKIDVISEQGEGTTFTVCLPLIGSTNSSIEENAHESAI